MMKLNKFTTKSEVIYGGNRVTIIEWKYISSRDEVMYHVENRQTNFKAWVKESQLTEKTNQN